MTAVEELRPEEAEHLLASIQGAGAGRKRSRLRDSAGRAEKQDAGSETESNSGGLERCDAPELLVVPTASPLPSSRCFLWSIFA